MSYIDTPNLPLHMPVPGTREPAQIALLNENCVVLSEHDHTNGKALAVGRLRSGLSAARPSAGTPGNVYFSTDTGTFSADTGTAWVDFLTSGGTGTITGWTLVDPIIRDTLQFGPEGSGTVDTQFSRSAAGTLHLSGTMQAVVFEAKPPGAGVGGEFRMYDRATGLAANYGSWFRDNAVTNLYDSVRNKAIAQWDNNASLVLDSDDGQPALITVGTAVFRADPGSLLSGFVNRDNAGNDCAFVGLEGGSSDVWRIYSTRGTAGNRINISLPTGEVSFIPVGGAPAITAGGQVRPSPDNVHSCGAVTNRWTAVYAVNGTIQTSSVSMKQDIAALDPAACVQAILDTDWVSFSYLPPPFVAPEPPAEIAYDAADSNEVKAEKKDKRDKQEEEARKAHARMVIETRHARKQNGYVLGSSEYRVSELFGLGDRESVSPQSDFAVLSCALQGAILEYREKIADLEARLNAIAA